MSSFWTFCQALRSHRLFIVARIIVIVVLQCIISYLFHVNCQCFKTLRIKCIDKQNFRCISLTRCYNFIAEFFSVDYQLCLHLSRAKHFRPLNNLYSWLVHFYFCTLFLFQVFQEQLLNSSRLNRLEKTINFFIYSLFR